MYDLVIGLAFIGLAVTPAIFAAKPRPARGKNPDPGLLQPSSTPCRLVPTRVKSSNAGPSLGSSL
jgi:hypothetical protein